MTTCRARSRAGERIARMCDATLDAETLRREIVAELERTIGFAAWGWPLADPDSLLATTGIADRAMWPIVPRLVDFEERAPDVNKDRELATRADPVGVLSGATAGDLARSSRWREILGPHGFADELRVACVDRFGCWGHLRLYRDAGDRAFTAEDASFLRDLAAPIAGALRRTAARPVASDVRGIVTPGIVVLDERLRVRSVSEGGDWMDAFVGRAPPRGLNARCAVFSVASRALAAGAEEEAAPPARARLALADGRWVVAEAARLVGEERGVVVTVRAATTGDVLDVVARARGLTRRERELVHAVVLGLDTRAIARRLSISPHTVQQHLKAVFAKVGVRSRRELVTGVFAADR